MNRLLAGTLAAALMPAAADPPTPPDRTLAQYTHQRWSEESDAPRPIFAIAQDKKGFLWLATARGLFRFDGIRFEAMSAGVDLISNGPPSALLVTRNGDIWTNFERSKRFAIYRDGQLRLLPMPPAPDRVEAMRQAPDGAIWVLTESVGKPLLRYRDGRWTHYWRNAGAPLDNPFSMVIASDGTVWVSFTASVARLPPGSSRFEFVQQKPTALGRLSVDPEGRIWLTERAGSYPITGRDGRGRVPPVRHPYRTDSAQIRGWPTFDREGNLWVATYYNGLERVNHPNPRGAATVAESSARVEHLTSRDGLTSDLTSEVFEDEDGNVWAGTQGGLDRYWPAPVRFEPELTDTAAFGDLLLRARDGSVYIGEAHIVYRVLPGAKPQPIFRTATEPSTLCEAPNGTIWVGVGKEVVRLENGHAARLPAPAPVEFTIYDCAFDAAGDYWITASFGGMARYHAGRWQRMFGPSSASFIPRSMLADEQGRIIVEWNDRALGFIKANGFTSSHIPLQGYKPEALALYSKGGSLYLGGDFGLARIRGREFQNISARQEPIFAGVNGVTQTRDGFTWLASRAGILRISDAELDRAFSGKLHHPEAQVFSALDGLRNPPHDHSRHAIVAGGDGRLWIATQRGTLWLDPGDLARPAAPSKVWVTSISADRIYRDPVSLQIPAGTRNMQVSFAVLNFQNPRGAKVRYMMEGQDAAWIEAGDRRDAFYTNLSPGRYRFRIAAANSDGSWNVQGASVDFTIAPTFFQSPWFIGLCVILTLALLWLAYRFRMLQIEATLRRQLAARLGERERIARELHDTLLQSVQGLILRFQTVADRMRDDDASKARLEEALTRADEVFAEGRSRVQDLRLAEAAGDFTELLRTRAAEAGFESSFPVRIVVEGKARPLHPLVSAELGRIAGEALFNVVRHAQARSVEITLRFSLAEVGMEIRDDGAGLPPQVLEQLGKPGHFGLIGMRERAERIGGRLWIESWPGQGTSVTITVPARLAFADTGRRSKLAKLLGWHRERPDA